MEKFYEGFYKKKLNAQILLLTFSDTEDRRKSLNSRETLKSLLKGGVVYY